MPFRSQRFEIIRRLGSGGMGVVYEARDRINGNLVAIKVLSDLDPESLLRFKTEFRALQNVHHPNLVQLYELIEEDGTWFFTMELVHGVAFDEYTRPGGEEVKQEGSTSRQGDDMPTRVDGRSGEASRFDASRSAPSNKKDASPEAESAEVSSSEVSSTDDSTTRDTMTEFRDVPGESGSRAPRRVSIAPRPGATLDEARLRRALAQLAAGLFALHQANKVHCDVKPSNVLVNDERAVLIDFGILLEVGRGGSSRSKIIGTPAFMAPEQAAMKTVGPAADWYAVGGILYLALTGRVPFAGRVDDVLEMKQRCEPVPPDSLVQGLPHDLVRLCVELLSLDPNARPTGADVVERLRSTYVSETRLPSAPREHFLGRQKELARLGDAFESSDKAGIAVVLHGEAGIGKSSLAARFTANLDAEGRAWVLTGRCDQRETVPFKALDEVFDALGSEIAARYSRGAAALLPERADLLAQTFPTLQRIPAFQQAPKHEVPVDERRTRDLVFGAAREFVAKLATHERLCILIEDLHWADPDSLALIIELMRAPSPAGVMLLATMRTSEAPEHLRDLKDALGYGLRVIEVTSLPPDEALSLAEHFVGTSAARAIIE
ncbi:MAG: serine/threonine-protein kinase, partial [Polyangiaceae bacterium]